MKILMLTCNNSLIDGINRHILAVAPALNQLAGIDVAVWVTFPQGEKQETLAKEGVKAYCRLIGRSGAFRCKSRTCFITKTHAHTHAHTG